MTDKVIHITEVLQLMNKAKEHRQEVSFKAWRIGNSSTDPMRGTIINYDRVYITSHSRNGSYNTSDPLSEDPRQKFRHVCEALIFEFMGKTVIW